MNRVAAAFVAACHDELQAPKPGNVHVFAEGHRMTASDFIRSAEAAAGPLAEPGARVGRRILRAVEATRAAVGTNTNLGIILLCAPLAAAAEHTDFRGSLRAVLDKLDREDAEKTFRAIVLASPAGLGTAEQHDVQEPATVTLRQAMAAAADRDRVAYQFSSAFTDIFDLGLPEYIAASGRWADPKWATLSVYLTFLAAFPDSHIARKYGISLAEEVRETARDYRRRLHISDAPEHRLGDLMTWDGELKQRGINPGTSADLTVATLFARRLLLPDAPNSG
jgi:triphosphoribosyl-dephospho-CoA synthase